MLDLTRTTVKRGTAASATHVLVVDDDPSVPRMIAEYLGDYGFRVSAVSSGQAADDALLREAIDLVVLDLRLPDEDGIQIARRLRESSCLPIIILTGSQEEVDRIMGLELGADDYLTKPFSLRELLARIRALLRRARAAETVADGLARIRIYRFAGYELNVRLRRLTTPKGHAIALTNSEFNLLVAFLAEPQCVLTRERLLDLSRLHNDEIYDRSVDVQVGRLRKKMACNDRSGPLIATERGAGYLFTAKVETIR